MELAFGVAVMMSAVAARYVGKATFPPCKYADNTLNCSGPAVTTLSVHSV